MIIVGLGHKKGVGKNYAALVLAKMLYPRKILITSWAWKLKDICYQLYSWDGMKDPDYYELHPEEKNTLLPTIGKTVRQIWIDMGTPAVRDIVYKETWVRYLINRETTSDVMIVTDTRFPNEAQAILNKNGILVKVTRDSVIKTDDVADCAMDGWEAWDYSIWNDHNGQESLVTNNAMQMLASSIQFRLNKEGR